MILYKNDQRLHDPRFEFDNGQIIPYQERPERIERALAHLSCLDDVFPVQVQESLPAAALESVHAKGLLRHIELTSQEVGRQEDDQPELAPLYRYPYLFPIRPEMNSHLSLSPQSQGCFAFDTYAPIGRNTWRAVVASASLAWRGAGCVLDGDRLVYALCRPPGHHAGYDYYGGYCYLNNAAIATHRLKSRGLVAILDLDYHHGNGTQQIFWQDDQVLTVSLHAHPAFEYPFFSGFSQETGGEQAPGLNLNLPLSAGCDDATYLQALDLALERIHRFAPASLILSAGYDTSARDLSTSFLLSNAVYEEIGRRIARLQIPILVVHEGGYAIEENGILSANLIRGLSIREYE